MPSTNNSSMAGFFMEPDTDNEVLVSLRKGSREGVPLVASTAPM